MTSISEAIEDLEERKAFMMRTCPQCWDHSINLALNGLKLIEKYTEAIEECVTESKEIFDYDLNFDDLVDCENSTRLETYRECSKMLHDLKWSIMNV